MTSSPWWVGNGPPTEPAQPRSPAASSSAKANRASKTRTTCPLAVAETGQPVPRRCKPHIASLQVKFKLDERVLAALCERYGASCENVASLVAEDGATAITDLPDYFSGEMRYLAREQRICHLADVVLRRTLLAIEGRCTQPALRMMAAVIGEELGWDETRQAHELGDTLRLLQQRHGVRVPCD